MTHGSLFSGIGGFDLAASWMGWENIFQVENDKFCTKVLEKNFPNTKRYGDIKEFDGTKYRRTIDILTGGFPCQPFSLAGKRKGAEDDRHLWPEMLRIIGEIQPAFIVGENVRGLLNWAKGLVFNQVQADLEIQGYQIAPLLLPACAINAPHRRDRIWFVAHTSEMGWRRGRSEDGKKQENIWDETNIQGSVERFGEIGTATIPIGKRLEKLQQQSNGKELQAIKRVHNQWQNWPTQSPVYRGNDGIPNRVDRIKSLGNAIVPQVAFEIFKAIEATLI